MIVRPTTDADTDIIKAVHEAAFGQAEEAELSLALLGDPSAEPCVSLMALEGERALGHVLFTRVAIERADAVEASILAPLAVMPEAQGRGIGGELVREGFRCLSDLGTALVFVLGDPRYYSRFGFRPAAAEGLQAPYPLPPAYAEAWMVHELRPGTLGTVQGRLMCADTLDEEIYWVE